MDYAILLDFTTKALLLVLMLSMPPIIVATVVGVLVSLLQALTQVQEQTLGFAIKLIVVILTLLLTAAWIGSQLLEYTLHIFTFFPSIAR
tara:strand:+ start:22707 stop:22976 length:270 start_codon:yes stop_codon:yes gene_type:complete